MELITAVQAAAIVTAILDFVTANIPAIVVLLGFGYGLKLFRGMFNRSTHGKI